MAEVLLISCNVSCEPYPVYPLGMTVVAEALRAHGHRVVEWDWLLAKPSRERIEETIRSVKPGVIGLSLRNIDNCDSRDPTTYDEPCVEAVQMLRELTFCPIVLGGAGYSLFPEQLLERIGADYGIAGEGETTFCWLVDRLADGSPPKERVFRGEAATSPTVSAPIARDPELASYYLREGGMLNLQTKRGCPHRCAYCTYPVIEGRTYRFRPPTAVVDEIEMLIGQCAADYYAIADSVFNDLEGHYLGIAEELVRRDIRVPWMAFFRPQRFQRDEVSLLKRAGLHAVEWGTDCACDATLELMQKDFTWAEVDESSRLFSEAGINNAHFIMFGGPGETEATVRDGLANIERLSDCVVFAFCGVRILPGTTIHRRAIDEGMVTAEQDLLRPRFYFSSGIARESLHEMLLDAFDGRRDRCYPPGGDSEKVHAFHRMGRRGPVWDCLLGGERHRRRR